LKLRKPLDLNQNIRQKYSLQNIDYCSENFKYVENQTFIHDAWESIDFKENVYVFQ